MKFNTTPLFAKRKSAVAICALTAMMALGTSNFAHAGGVALGSTRLIYPQGNKQVEMNISNTDKQDGYLIQSWVSTPDGKKDNDFVITPPLFLLKPTKDNVLRIMYTGPQLTADKETLFYLNSKAIPSAESNTAQQNALQIATQSTIKMFMRPANLSVKSSEAPGMLHCKMNGSTLQVTNPSPYFVTLVNFTAGGQKLPNTMVPPKDSVTVKAAAGAVAFQTMNDFGAMTTAQSCKS
ncbi:molecular chaperone FimC [Buttiauxella sp. B2]|uniref:fimbria/pilus periplasmic chaperone n=1 Tax=Buttiauxella sp. B2 TaxID=2587812 RepID=UPI00111EE8CA|nr:fimbria/pilus periplasmic chaperone [Buttiauxella sp. B2]TNV20490.1 molecular chaperone FimC [Buttiauxella sp. B2]